MNDIRFAALVLNTNAAASGQQLKGMSSQRITPGSNNNPLARPTASVVKTSNTLTNSGGESDENIAYDNTSGGGGDGGLRAVTTY